MVATITGDFFGDGELAGMGVDVGVDHLVSLEGAGPTNTDWVLPNEAFDQRREINEPTREEELLGEDTGGGGGGEGGDMETVTVEDKTSAVVVWTAVETRPVWSPANCVAQTLTWLAGHIILSQLSIVKITS